MPILLGLAVAAIILGGGSDACNGDPEPEPDRGVLNMINFDNLTVGGSEEAATYGFRFSRSYIGHVTACRHDKERPVVIWTDKRGVIFGYTENVDARPIVLRNARMCLYWPSSVGGVFGLCDIGPNKESKISATLPSANFDRRC